MAHTAAAEPAPAPPARPTLETLARRLEGAVARVSPSAQSLTGGPETTQALHMTGIGVVIVLPARALPQQRRQFSLRPRMREQPPAPSAEPQSAAGTAPTAPSAPPRMVAIVPAVPLALEQLQRELEQEMALRAQLFEAMQRAQQGDDRLLQRAVELQVLAIGEQAEAFRLEVERARARAETNLRVQLGTLQRPPSPPPAPAPAPPAADASAAAGPAPPPE